MDSSFVKPLILWYNQNARLLPWRGSVDPYRVWVSEIMLQQTRVEAVIGYFERFVSALPDVWALAACPEDRLLKLWEGLGYYSRARNLQKAARVICRDYGGELPNTANALQKLPGIGDYTAGAIASIAFGEAEPAVDGNVLRVFARLALLEEDILKTNVRRRVREELRHIYPEPDGTWGILNQAFMDLGSGICRANASPKCGDCPLAELCLAHRTGREEEFPVRENRTKKRDEERTVFLVRDGEKVAVTRRPPEGLLAGLYEFPNCLGHLEPEQAVDYLLERGFSVQSVTPLADARHVFSHLIWRMRGYELRIAPLKGSFTGSEETEHDVPKDAGKPGTCNKNACRKAEGKGGAMEDWIFVKPSELERTYALPSAFAKYAALLMVRRKPQTRSKAV